MLMDLAVHCLVFYSQFQARVKGYSRNTTVERWNAATAGIVSTGGVMTADFQIKKISTITGLLYNRVRNLTGPRESLLSGKGAEYARCEASG